VSAPKETAMHRNCATEAGTASAIHDGSRFAAPISGTVACTTATIRARIRA